MAKALCFLHALLLFISWTASAQRSADYRNYHYSVIRAEVLITEEKFEQALAVMDSVFNVYPYVFLRDYQVGAQVALYVGEKTKSFNYLRGGIKNGWTLNDINANQFLQPLTQEEDWKILLSQYDSLSNVFFNKVNSPIGKEMLQMFLQDQELAKENLDLQDDAIQEKFLLQRFAPQSEQHMHQIKTILKDHGYPGEKLIGNRLWAWTLLSHHNSISPTYNQLDTLYPSMRPLLLQSIKSGELSPYDFAIIEEWRITVASSHKEKSYGYINTLSAKDIHHSNQLRRDIGMRSIETTNKLVDIQLKTGIHFYLEGDMWVSGKIPVEN